MNSSPMLDKDLRPKKRPGLNERILEGEVLILDRINGRIHHLNPTASYVWKQCDGSSAKAIAEKLVQAFQIDLATAERDVNKVLGEMKRMNLLEICD
jgi:Coenzyme PQQ synthesis protein D (PqqD)